MPAFAGMTKIPEQALRIASGNGTDAPVAGSTHTITTLPSA